MLGTGARSGASCLYYTYSPFLGLDNEMVILQCQGDDVSVGVFARMIRLGRVLDGVAGCDESDFLHYLGLAYVPWPVVDVNQLKSYRRGERNEISVRLASVLQCLVVGHDSAILHNEEEGSHWSYPNHE